MSRSWISARRKDAYYRKAKAQGYRSRAAYKLIQIDDRFHILRKRGVVLDLGGSPGGWSQVALDRVGPGGRVVAVDMASMGRLEGLDFVRGDLREGETLARVLALLPDGADCVISDMSPKLSGNRPLDHARSMELAEIALEVAEKILRDGGNFVTKVLQGDMYEDLLRKVAKGFDSCKGFAPKASLARSAESYIVAKGWRGGTRRKV